MTSENPVKLSTRVAYAGYDFHRFMGFGVFDDLAGKVSLTDLVAIAITGRRLSTAERDVLDDVAAISTVADPRIWLLKVAQLVASHGGALTGVAAALLNMDNRYVSGWRVSPVVARFLVQLRADLGDRADDVAASTDYFEAYLAREPIFPGFGIPFRPQDERLVALRACMHRRGRADLPYWRAMEQVAAIARSSRHLEPNILFGFAAACLDCGLAAEDIGPLSVVLVVHCFLANALESARQAPALLQRLPDVCIEYFGKPPRVSPRAADKTGTSQRAT